MSTITALDPSAPEAQPAREGAKRTRKVLVKKVKPPVPIKKYLWLGGHGLTITFGTIYSLFYIFKWFLSSWYWTPRICYRLSFIGVLVSYSITVSTTFGSNLPDYQTLLATENFQNLLLATAWFLSRPSLFKLMPYFFVTSLQLASHFNLPISAKHLNQISDVVAFSEIIVIFALLFDTLLFKGGSGIAFTIYLGFYWLRLNFSPYTQVYILKIVKLIDDKVISKQKPEIQAKWQKIKDFIEYRRSETSKDGLEIKKTPTPIQKTVSKQPVQLAKTESNQSFAKAIPNPVRLGSSIINKVGDNKFNPLAKKKTDKN